MPNDLYSDLLLDLYRNPLNKKALAKFDARSKNTNPLCGEEVEVFIKFDKQGKITDIGWQGEGCAISQASASMLTDYVKGKTKTEIKKLGNTTAKAGSRLTAVKEILAMLGLEKISPTRMRCALLGLKAIQQITSNEAM